jgi:hypothetical protein
MRKFRTLISQLTAATPQQVLDSSSFVAAVRRSATRIDVMVERLLPAMIATQESTPASLLVPETRPDR